MFDVEVESAAVSVVLMFSCNTYLSVMTKCMWVNLSKNDKRDLLKKCCVVHKYQLCLGKSTRSAGALISSDFSQLQVIF